MSTMLIDKEIIGRRIKQLRIAKNLKVKELAEMLGITQPALSKVETGKRGISIEVARKLSDIFNVSIDYILGNTDEPHPVKSAFEKAKKKFKNYLDNAKVVPLFDGVHAGDVGYFMDNSNAVGTFLVPCDKLRGINPDFVVEVHGDSMEPEITDGSLVAVQKNAEIKNGDMVVVVYDDGALVKKIFFQDGVVTLQSLNPRYAPIVIKKGEKELYISGKVVYIIKFPK